MTTNSIESKWLIPDSPKNTSHSWNEDHQQYPDRVFSLTVDPTLCRTLIKDLPDLAGANVLIPGCGSEVSLQAKILELCPNIGRVISTDFSQQAIAKSSSRWESCLHSINGYNAAKFEFSEADSTRLTKDRPEWEGEFDYVLVVNSVLSDLDAHNRQMLAEFHRVLKPGGKLYGFFPTVLCGLEILSLPLEQKGQLEIGEIDLISSMLHERKQDCHQIFYMPLRLRRIFKEVGFDRVNFEIFFCESEYFNSKDIYGIDDPDICIWEFLVRLHK
jgi:SAM-dependent methyltransferase